MNSRVTQALLGVIAVALVAVVVLLATGRGSDGEQSADAGQAEEPHVLDRAAWEAELVTLDGIRANPDMETLERLTLENCERTADDWAMYLSFADVHTEATRLNVEYVCPDKLPVFDEGAQQLADTVASFDEMCAKAPAERTADEQEMVDAVGC